MIKLSNPYIPDKSLESIVQVIKSGKLVQGEQVKEFENILSEYLKVKYSVIVSSGTAALHLSLIALGIQEGDEVILPAFSFPATANVVEMVGAKPVFADISIDDFCIDPAKIIQKITKKTKAIIPVHEFGQAAYIEKIVEIANNYNLFVVEDAACALGTCFNNTKAGTFGDIGCFSFHPRKIITTGEGGAIVTNDIYIANKISNLRNHGIEKENGKIDFLYPGLNYRMTDFQAILGIAQIKLIEKIIDEHIRQADLYNNLLSELPEIIIPKKYSERRNIYQTYHIILKDKRLRDGIMIELNKRNIEVNYGANAIHILKFYKDKYNYNRKDFSNALLAYEHGLALPIGMHLNSKHIDIIVSTLKEVINGF